MSTGIFEQFLDRRSNDNVGQLKFIPQYALQKLPLTGDLVAWDHEEVRCN